MGNETLITSAHQPGYLPYIGFFSKIVQSDLFVMLDDVQYVKKEWHNRNKIREPNRGWIWLTVPVYQQPNFPNINEVRIDNSRKWQQLHWKRIQAAYRRAPFFEHYKGFFEDVYSKKWEKLIDLNETIIRYILNELDIQTKIIKSSTLQTVGRKTDLIIDICKKTNSDTYLSGIGGYQYLDERKVKENDITLLYQDFKHPVYPQRWEPFVPNLSTIDMMFNIGNEESREQIIAS